MKSYRLIMVAIACASLAACQTTPQKQPVASCKPLGGERAGNSNTTNAAIGAAAGAVLGGVIGNNVGGRHSNVRTRNGVLLGALGGALAGSQYNKMIGMTEQDDGSVKLNIPGSVMFSTGSAQISPEFGSTLNSVASTITEYCGVTATIIGHTDSTGTPAGNAKLSIDRADSVAAYLVTHGVAASRLEASGRGQEAPIAPNTTEVGRAQNRRVEIFVRPPNS